MYKCKHFKVQELVSKIVYQKYGEFCWRFFSDELKQDLDTIREYHGMSITINDWVFGGANNFTQCGFRSNLDPLVKGKSTLYCSAHCMGKAFDLHSKDNKKLYNDVVALKNAGKLKAVSRLESPTSTKYGWVHIDEFGTENGKLEVFIA